jgi:hypothetical protein
MSDTSTLKPCPVPWCASQHVTTRHYDAKRRQHWVECYECNFKTPQQSSRIKAVSLWNTRADAQVSALVEALENINRKASPRPDRTLDECADELYWCASEARQALAAFGGQQ